MSDASDYILYAAVGAAGGALVTVAAWGFINSQLKRDLRGELDREIGPRVATTIDQRLAAAGITRQTGERLSALLEIADRIGLI